MYVRREAVLSSQIEGTQSTLEDVLSYELDPRQREIPQDVEEVVNYVRGHELRSGTLGDITPVTAAHPRDPRRAPQRSPW